MTTITGTYFKGRLKLDRSVKITKPVKVTVMFENDVDETGLKLTDFSFSKMQELLKDCKTSFADEVIEERRTSV